MKSIFYLVFSLLFISCGTSKQSADLAIINGTIYTSTGEAQQADIIIQNQTILDIGKGIAKKYESKQVIDANEQFVMPGLIDAHAHFQGIGKSLKNINLLGVPTWAECLEKVKAQVGKAEDGEWIIGRGWHQDKWTDSPSQTVEGNPTHHDLSAISPNNPVLLSHASGHGILVNAKAMELAGITAKTISPKGGVIIKDKNGQPIGVFQENAEGLVTKFYKESRKTLTEEQKLNEWLSHAKLAQEECLRYGITSLHDAGITLQEFEQYKSLAESNQLNVRLYAMMRDYALQQASEEDMKKVTSYKHPKFQCNAIKAFMDGALGSRGAWLIEEYADKPNYFGENITSIESLRKTAELAKKYEMQLCIHAIGDKGNREVLNVFERTLGFRLDTARWRIEHAQHLHPDEIQRIAQRKVIASMQTIHCTSDSPFVEKRLGQHRAEEGAYVWQSLLKANAKIANGTDAPIEQVNPFDNLYAAVTRKRVGEQNAFYPKQVMTRKQALDSYTIWNAYAAFQENEKGSLEVGKLADIVLLDTNLLTCPPKDILNTKVIHTIVGGKVVYSKQ